MAQEEVVRPGELFLRLPGCRVGAVQLARGARLTSSATSASTKVSTARVLNQEKTMRMLVVAIRDG